MNRGRQKGFSIGGYTIVETLIFLAVSSVIFMIAVIFIGGQQSRTQFQASVRSFESQLTDIANDVATGYYHSSGSTKTCDATGAPTGAPTPLGTNEKCTFIGTVIKLGSDGDNESFVQFTMTGLRESGGVNTPNLAQARPRTLDAGKVTPLSPGLTVKCVSVDNNYTTCNDANAAIGFFTTFEGAALDEEGGAVQANSISYDPISITTSTADSRAIIDGYNYAAATTNRRITICLVGGANQYALVTLGGNAASGGSSSLSVTSEIREGNSCAP